MCVSLIVFDVVVVVIIDVQPGGVVEYSAELLAKIAVRQQIH